jgi:type IV secretory pathway VirD2 relaxase
VEGFTVFEPMAQGAPTNPFENIQAKAKQIPKKEKFTLNKKDPRKQKKRNTQIPFGRSKRRFSQRWIHGGSLVSAFMTISFYPRTKKRTIMLS